MTFRTINKNDRVMIFLDLANITRGLSEHDGLENCLIDHVDLVNMLVEGRSIVGAMVFDTKSFFKANREAANYLSEIGYKIVGGHYADGMQKEVDVSIAVEMIMHAVNDHYDVAILISGDRDFIPAISAVQDMGKKVEVAAFGDTIADAMVYVSDRYTDLAKIPMVYYVPSDENHNEEIGVNDSGAIYDDDPDFEPLENLIACEMKDQEAE